MWDLWVNGMPTITFDSAQAAARSVYQGRSGFVGWDTLEENNAPEDISGWTKKEYCRHGPLSFAGMMKFM